MNRWKLIHFETMGTVAVDDQERPIGHDNIQSGFDLLHGEALEAFDAGRSKYDDLETYRSVAVLAQGFLNEAPFASRDEMHPRLVYQLRQLVTACNNEGINWGRLVLCEQILKEAAGIK